MPAARKRSKRRSLRRELRELPWFGAASRMFKEFVRTGGIRGDEFQFLPQKQQLELLRLERPFSCMMLDLDHFKQVNDNYGHQVGDQILQEFTSRCKSSIREIDLLGRYGGEELIVLLPETNRDLAVQIGKRLRASIAEHPIHVAGTEIQLTVSIGVATRDENTSALEALIARADQAMYIAKHQGRNQVAISL